MELRHKLMLYCRSHLDVRSVIKIFGSSWGEIYFLCDKYYTCWDVKETHKVPDKYRDYLVKYFNPLVNK